MPLLFINLNAQDQVDPLEAARLANSAAEKSQAEADAATIEPANSVRPIFLSLFLFSPLLLFNN